MVIDDAKLTEEEMLLEVWALPEALGFGQKPPKNMTEKQRHNWSLTLRGRDAAITYIQEHYGEDGFKSPLEGIDPVILRLIADAATAKALWTVRSIAEYAIHDAVTSPDRQGGSFISASGAEGVRAFILWMERELRSAGIEQPKVQE